MSYSNLFAAVESGEEEPNEAGVAFDNDGSPSEEEVETLDNLVEETTVAAQSVTDANDAADDLEDAVQGLEAFCEEGDLLSPYVHQSFSSRLASAMEGKDYILDSFSLEDAKTTQGGFIGAVKLGFEKAVEMLKKAIEFVRDTARKLWIWLTDKSPAIAKRAKQLKGMITGNRNPKQKLTIKKLSPLGEVDGRTLIVDANTISTAASWLSTVPGEIKDDVGASMKVSKTIMDITGEASALIGRSAAHDRFTDALMVRLERSVAGEYIGQRWGARSMLTGGPITEHVLPRGKMPGGASLVASMTSRNSLSAVSVLAVLKTISLKIDYSEYNEFKIDEKLEDNTDANVLMQRLHEVEKCALAVKDFKRDMQQRYDDYDKAVTIAEGVIKKANSYEGATDTPLRAVGTFLRNTVFRVASTAYTKVLYRRADLTAAHALKVCNAFNAYAACYTGE